MTAKNQFCRWGSATARHPASILSAWTLLVFAAALALGWKLPSNAGCTPAYNMCVQPSGGNNGCGTNTACQPTGSGYSCQYQYPSGSWGWVTDKCYEIFASSPWPSCVTAGSTAPSCGYYFQSCGTTFHFMGVSSCSNANCGKQCVGTWWWEACKAIGTPCGTGTGGGN